jgi:PAS domain S-box-containing protein
MWAIIKGTAPVFDLARWFLLVISLFFLFEFGRRIFQLEYSQTPLWQKAVSRMLRWWVSPLIGILIFLFGFFTDDFLINGGNMARYLLALPGGILAGFGFSLYYDSEVEKLEPLKVKKYFIMLGFSFVMYGVLSGIFVSKGNIPPSNVLNSELFFSVVKVPVQVFLGLCAIASAWAVSGMFKIFNWEVTVKLQEAQVVLRQQLRETQARYMDIVKNSTDMIHSIDKDFIIIDTNVPGHSNLGYSGDELVGKHIRDAYPPDTWRAIERRREKLIAEGSLFIDDVSLIAKDGTELGVQIHLLPMYDKKKEFIGARLIIRDVTDKIRLNDELRKKVMELEQFHDMAVDRELKMVELKKEIERLKKELGETKKV